jgi:orotate phosphoribosyltransferase
MDTIETMDTAALLRESGALLEGHFLLSSGRHSARYFQCARLFQYPDRAAAALGAVADRIRGDMDALRIDAVAGPALGGIIAAYELGRQLGLRALFTERDEGGVMVLRRGFDVEKGERILIVEDVVTTGKSSAECAAALESRGAVIVALSCLVDRRAPGQALAWPLYAACALEADNRDADDCALCKQGIPLIKPGSRPPIGGFIGR